MDAETERLIARTRQRRELLNQKMGKTPEAAPRKRRTPLTEDLTTSNVVEEPSEQTADDSPKRQCMNDNAKVVKPDIDNDTPSNASVRSRLQNLASQHAQWSETGADSKEDESTPVPVPRKSLSSPPLQRGSRAGAQENANPASLRKSRFAQLAQNIDDWEDDLSHPTIVKEEEKKPRWQPPKATTSANPTHVSSPKKTRAPPPPSKGTTSSNTPAKKSIVSSMSRDLTNSTPARSGSKVGYNSSPKPFQPYSARTPQLAHVRSPSSAKSYLNKGGEQSQVDNQLTKRGKETPGTAPKPMSNKPLSAQSNSWESKATMSNVPGSARSGTATSSSVGHTPKQTCTPVKPTGAPAQDDSHAVQMRRKVRKSIDDEPTAHSVSARMSAWEHMSSIQEVSNIKKVRPGETTPTKTSATTATPVLKKSPTKVSLKATPSKNSSLTPSKSFKDSIKERAAQVNPVTAAEADSGTSPNKGLSPKKASVAMQAVQQHLVQQTQSTSMAERLRQERMAELQSIQDRWKNGILKGDDDQEETPKAESVSKRQGTKEKARKDFENKLAAIGFDASDEHKTSVSASKSQKSTHRTETPSKAPEASPAPPPPPPPPPTASGSKVTGRPPRPNSLYSIVSQTKKSGTVNSPKPGTTQSYDRKPSRKVKFDDSFDSDESEQTDVSLPKKQAIQINTEVKYVTGVKDDISESDTTEDGPTEVTEDDSDYEVVLRRPHPNAARKQPKRSDEDDDLSLSAFVPASVRRQSILPSSQQPSVQGQNRDSDDDSFEGHHHQGTRTDNYGRTSNHVRLGHRHADTESSSSLTSQSTVDSTSDFPEAQHRSGYSPEDTGDSYDDRDAIGDLLDEAMDSDSEESASARPSAPVMRKRPSHRKATEDGSLPFSINEYRASRNMQTLEVKQTIIRNSHYSGMHVKEEEVEMPTHRPTPAPRQSIQERIRELQELVQQEQNIIMQTSNALNQCCTSASNFAGSVEQVECNRILLISCQKRQSYMMEIQRIRDTKTVEQSGSGPKGTLTISDIRLPLKKEFVTKIGSGQDATTYYFIILLRNGPQVICTQMLSTHDPMMRGSLDFPNLIKINGITGSFRLQLEIYSMSVSREAIGRAKKKTPKKMKGNAQTVQSPAGPTAVRTTSFSQVTCVQLTMKSLDKHSFSLERLSHLSPLHGMIYMNLKCMMEANVEERGFLTMFEDVSGFGSWHRRWCALSGNKVQFWKYPDDETRKDPMGSVDLKRCVTEKVGLISRDICARPNTFELVTVRQPRRGEKDTLVSRTYNTMTTIKHMLSADTKEERIVWCNKINRALANIRTWHSDAMRPIRN